MSERYNQPFWVGYNSRFKYARNGYLPPLEPPPGYYGWGYSDPPEEEEYQRTVRPMSKSDVVGQMKGQLLYLMSKVHELERARTKRRRGVY